ncbi:response regulator transcription factor [Alkaliphilus serpentinus]|uniref:Stage 0 sporulation protein A homolog n=1 Tax=Alkaliphilus serpentinus TaxID=1482731 RepID=A0A833HL88_9FIRM|nr:response regulator transcription factor [Alkaliphilus serpentinus]KAB3525515.1 response regulator transcription factor [Alkaliphilus serpentinus]
MKILIAEDEKDIRELLRINLEKEGYKVFCAKDGNEALEVFYKNKIDLAIFDIMMPILDGLNLLRKIRETSSIPIIILTARGEEMDKVLGFGLGADDYLVKPFSMAELIARIEARLRRSYENAINQKSTLLTIGELTLDIDGWCVSKNGVKIELNAKEFSILKSFMENPERVFTKKQLYSAAWEDDYLYDDNTIMVHISRIRNKIEADPHNPVYIKTIKGVGYKFCKGDLE